MQTKWESFLWFSRQNLSSNYEFSFLKIHPILDVFYQIEKYIERENLKKFEKNLKKIEEIWEKLRKNWEKIRTHNWTNWKNSRAKISPWTLFCWTAKTNQNAGGFLSTAGCQGDLSMTSSEISRNFLWNFAEKYRPVQRICKYPLLLRELIDSSYDASFFYIFANFFRWFELYQSLFISVFLRCSCAAIAFVHTALPQKNTSLRLCR